MVESGKFDALCASSGDTFAKVQALISKMGSSLVAFSGGVDSTLVLKVAKDILGPKVTAFTALSPSVAPEEQAEAAVLCRQMGVPHVTVQSNELADPQYVANAPSRCYFCKTELYSLCAKKRTELGLQVILDGFNADDFKDHRPGHRAAQEHGVRSPLAEAGMTKDMVRAWSRRLGLQTWDKPQLACLASRIPYGTAVTQDRLVQIGSAESELRGLGLRTFRVRYHGDVARLEISAEEYPLFSSEELRQKVNLALQRRGFKFVAVDLEPFRTGRMNDVLPR